MFWLQEQIHIFYPGLWAVGQELLIAFPSSYLVEQGFSAVTDLILPRKKTVTNNQSRRLKNAFYKNRTKINRLLEKHQAHSSH